MTDYKLNYLLVRLAQAKESGDDDAIQRLETIIREMD